MKIICSSQDETHRITFSFNIWLHLVVPALFVAVFMGVLVKTQLAGISKVADDSPIILNPLASEENNKIKPISSSESYEIDVNILARRLGALEAESLRLNAFGTRIVNMAKLDPEEFAFDSKPSQGGASVSDSDDQEESEAGYGISADELMKSINTLEKQLLDQRNRLEGMMQVLNGRILDKEVMPNGMPIEKGYISSRYGFRRDPFTGHKRMHQGIDFAGRKGTPVHTVAGGVVQFVGRKGGYGNVVEVDHGNGLVSRYAHLNSTRVKTDQVVNKGEKIASVGSTGRSTGPHLHLEVLKKGIRQNPARYF